VRVLLDGQVAGADGIGRCTSNLIAALRRVAACEGLRLHVEPPSDVPRYSSAEGTHLLKAAHRYRADLLHLLDYRVPLDAGSLPLVPTVHDVLRLRHPEHCYTDEAFLARFGSDGMSRLRQVTTALRTHAPWPPGATRDPASSHEEFYGRMTSHAAGTAAAVFTPTHTVAAQLVEAVGHPVPTRATPWGVDHLAKVRAEVRPARRELRKGEFVLYVGQARSHKGLPVLLEAFQRSRARHRGLKLALAGRDFAEGNPATRDLPDHVVPLGEVTDAHLAYLYARAAVVAHLAQHEGFGFPPLEAVSFGAQVLVADIPVMRETLGSHAYFTDPHDPAEASRALDHLLAGDDPAAHRQARTAWAERYRWDTCARGVLDCYREVLA
jgi:glycosyltransferase involved in cell wall biosynthesis